MVVELIEKYFNYITDDQRNKFSELMNLYSDWNSKINVISRKDMDQFYLHHVVHSLTLTKFVTFSKGTKIMDLGTGGGFPGIPLAIYYPEVEFVLLDSIGKKIKVVQEVANSLQLQNLRAYHVRAEEHHEKFHYVVSRAVSTLKELIQWTKYSFEKKELNPLPNGIIAYKGGNLTEELKEIKKSNPFEQWTISDHFSEDYFKQKYLIYVQK
ncbi:MAG: 16S rRNA (guanine(527)-N(7))-methyltransferase RsmG [Saprospiraceae bacterium]|nr:16S rRNA (guanine(527)-N(7))-methyltransferase RsmG [Saprospiraceae bacterium]